ncbi:TonB family protein [Gallaecimonas kandeliae]|uniref:TonB family protein n=1 Tax=Gallaecimonas kandeliae TaxID=3029055 RepID=UPI002649B2E9|nr:TonB family protein [Gallaecimonas kandeliae]WKE65093.1 TonB family protein [Gallaecimonas kandeliae]
MTDWLLAQSLPLSLVLAVLLLAGPVLQRLSGAITAYRLWLLAPATLVLGQVAGLWPHLPKAPLQHYLITGSHALAAAMPPDSPLPWLWALGASALLAFGLVNHWRFGRRFHSRPWQGRLGQAEGLTVLSCEGISSPLLSGPLPTRLLLPADFERRYSHEQQQLVLRHELCHWRRGDLWWNLLALGLLLAFWFNPLCWLAYRRYRRDQELACDQAVLAQEGKSTRIAYGKALIQSLEGPQYQGPTLLNYIDKESMMERLTQLQKSPLVPRWRALAATALGLALASGVALAGQDNGKTGADGPSPIYRANPRYPVKAVADGTTGYVVVSLDITPLGTVANPRVVKSEPAGVFDKEALKAISQWRYQPSAKGSKDVQLQMNFALDDGAAPKSHVKADQERIDVGA